MAEVRTTGWQIIAVVAAIVLLIGWMLSWHLIPGIVALLLVLAMLGGAILYRWMAPPEV